MNARAGLLLIFTMIGFTASAQHTTKDSVDSWRLKSIAYARAVDSFRIIAVSVNSDQVLVEQQMRNLGDSLNRIAGRDIKMNIHNDPRVDSLNQRLVELKLVGMFLNERFEYRLIQIDSCLSTQNELDRKIYETEHKK